MRVSLLARALMFAAFAGSGAPSRRMGQRVSADSRLWTLSLFGKPIVKRAVPLNMCGPRMSWGPDFSREDPESRGSTRT